MGTLTVKYKFDRDGAVFKYGPKKFAGSGNAGIGNERVMQVCYEMTGYNYENGNIEDCYYWSVSIGCQSLFYGGAESYSSGNVYGEIGSGGGGGGGVGAAKTFTVVSGNNPIGNISEYNKCFTNVAGGNNVYSITLCVSQPEAGSRETWGMAGTGSSAPGNPVSVGHTFLIFNENSTVGSTIRNVGFYPAIGASPLSPQSQGQLNNDANHDYDIALTIVMDNSQFFQVLNFVNQGNEKGYQYNLNTNNCTTFALNALASAGIDLPRTTGIWLNGSGLNPGDLGEDIRQMQLPANMTRTTLTGTHPNIGFCY